MKIEIRMILTTDGGDAYTASNSFAETTVRSTDTSTSLIVDLADGPVTIRGAGDLSAVISAALPPAEADGATPAAIDATTLTPADLDAAASFEPNIHVS